MIKLVTYCKQKIASIIPLRFNVAAPVVQLFTRVNGKSTRYTLLNFPSMLSPGTAKKCRYSIKLYDQSGLLIAKKILDLDIFGSLEVIPEKIWDIPLPEYGIFVAQIIPTPFFSIASSHLGRIKAHFYAFYHDVSYSSLALVHPQTVVSKAKDNSLDWESSCNIDTGIIDYIEVYQINPSPNQVSSSLRVLDSDGNILLESKEDLKPFGTRLFKVALAEWISKKYIHMGASCLTAPNAKPIVFNYFKNGVFSAAHS